MSSDPATVPPAAADRTETVSSAPDVLSPAMPGAYCYFPQPDIGTSFKVYGRTFNTVFAAAPSGRPGFVPHSMGSS